MATTQKEQEIHCHDDQGLLASTQSVDGAKSTTEYTTEKRKVVVSNDRLRSFYSFLLFHFAPLGMALALIVLNIKTCFYGPDLAGLSLLQYVSKAHEVLMQGSVATIMVVYLQYLLTHESAVPFGAVFTSFRVSQVSVIWSPELWAAVTTKDFSGQLYLGFICLVPFSILLASTIGPSSAIALLPRQTNYRLPDWPLGTNLSYASLFPDTLGHASPPLTNRSATENELSFSAGWEYLRALPAVSSDKQTETGLQTGTINLGDNTGRMKWDMPRLYSVLIPTVTPWSENLPGTSQVVRSLYVQYAPNSTLATVQHVPVALSLSTAAKQFAASFSSRPVTINASIETPQPYASTFCHLNTILSENDTRPIQFPKSYIAGCGDSCDSSSKNWPELANYTRIRREDIWADATSSPQGRLIWVDDIVLDNPASRGGIGVIVVQPELCNAGKVYLTASACVVGARWGNTTAHLEIASNGLATISKSIVSELSTVSPITVPRWSDPPLRISTEWANSLNQRTSNQNRTVADNLLRALPITDNVCPFDGTYGLDAQQSFPLQRPYMHEALISSLVANALSHSAGASEQWWEVKNAGGKLWNYMNPHTHLPEDVPKPPGLVFTFQGSLRGYAWTMDGVPIKIALVFLGLYCIFVSVFVLYTVISGYSSMPWSTVADLVALALSSTPSNKLCNTSGGIGEMKTFKHLVTVREIENHHRLELVFPQDGQDRGPIRRVARNIAY